MFKNTLSAGFALFSIFFGAGNLLFPPLLGLQTGESYFIAFLGFILGDVILSVIVLMACAKSHGHIGDVYGIIGNFWGKVIIVTSFLIVGPLFAVPRTASVTMEMAIEPFFDITLTAWQYLLLTAVFFVIVYFFATMETKVIDFIGKFITPVLLLMFLIIGVKAIVSPIADISTESIFEHPFAEGVKQGYLTMDAIGALVSSLLIVHFLRSKGYHGNKLVSGTVRAGIIAGILLAIVYGCLTFVGASYASLAPDHITTTNLLPNIVKLMLGSFGYYGFILIVMLACLSTAVGLLSSISEYFVEFFNEKFSYRQMILAFSAISFVFANLKFDVLVQFYGPVLEIVYPIIILLAVLYLCNVKTGRQQIAIAASLTSLLVNICILLSGYIEFFEFVKVLPLYTFGFAWLPFSVVAGVIARLCVRK